MDNQLFLLLSARKLSGEARPEDIAELEKFLEDEVFRKKFELLKAHWENRNGVSTNLDAAFQKVLVRMDLEKNDQANTDSIDSHPQKPGVIKFMLRFSKVAAIVIICLAAAYFFYKKPAPVSDVKIASSSSTLQTRQTPKGEKSTFTLSDGTKVIMNADSKLQFPSQFSGNTREVYLTGEAFFDVAHNAERPFIIHTDKINIKVLGTEFNVKSYPEDSTSETTLIHGLIEVTLKDRPDDRIILKPKEKLIVSGSSEKKISSEIKKLPGSHPAELLISNLHYIPDSDSAVVETSWIDNKLVFQDESFGKLAADMSRKYDVEIQFLNNAIKDYRFTGIFEKETINEALEALKLTERFNYKMDGITITIY